MYFALNKFILLILLQYQEAKNTFLYACKKSPSCISWLGVGIACYRVRQHNIIMLCKILICLQKHLENVQIGVWESGDKLI